MYPLSLESSYLFLMVFFRTTAFLFLIPTFNAGPIPVQLRIGLSATIAILLMPLLPDPSLPLHPIDLATDIAQELFLGILLGFSVRIFFFIVEMAGVILSREMGFIRGEVFNPLLSEQVSAIGNTLFYFSLIVFFVSGFYYDILFAFFQSFVVLPVGGFTLNPGVYELVAVDTASIFLIGALIAGPLICVNFVVLFAFAILGKAVPKMNVFTVSFAVRILVGVIFFGLIVPRTCYYLLDILGQRAGQLLEYIEAGALPTT